MEDLTKEQQRFATTLYKIYLQNRDNSVKNPANLGDAPELQKNHFQEYDCNKITALCSALRDRGYLTYSNYDNIATIICLSDKTIIYMENRFVNGLKDVVAFLTKFI